MKRLINKGLSALMAAVMLMTVIVSAPFTVNADDSEPEFVFSEETNYYDGSKYLKLIKYNGSDENVVVPDRVPDDYPDENLRGRDFSIIAENAFENNTNIKSVTMGDNIGHIAGYCFANCSELTEVRIGTGLTYFGNNVFSGCSSLKKIRILSTKSDFDMAPYAINNNLDVVVYGYSGTALEQKMTANRVPFVPIDHTLRHVNRVDPTEYKDGNIEYWYYTDTEKYYNNEQARVDDEITEQQTILPYFSFEQSQDGSYRLTKYNGSSRYVTVPETIPENYPDASLRGKTVTVIYDEAFKDNTDLISVYIPDSIEYVNEKSFDGCTDLETVYIGTGLKYLGELCFANCPELEKVTINSEKNTFNMKYDAFLNSTNVTIYGHCGTAVQMKMNQNNIRFESLGHVYGDPVWSWSEDKSSVTATFTCEKCQEEKTVDATISIERTEPTHSKEGEIKYTATAVINEQTYTDVKTEAIPKLHELRHIEKVFPTQEQNGNIEYWYCPECGKYYSDASGDEDKEIDEKDTILPLFTFGYDGDHLKLLSYNGNYENVIVPEKVPDNYPDNNLQGNDFYVIGDAAFKDNTTLKNVIIQDNIDNVGTQAFKGCVNLTEVTIGNDLDYLSWKCFADCPALKKVTIYSRDNEFNLSSDAFSGSNGVTVYGYHDTKVEKFIKYYNISFAPLEHIYGEPVWSWSDDYSSATAAFTCTHEDDTQTLDAQVTSEVTKQAACTEEGEITYTATVTFEGKTYTDVKKVAQPKKHKLERVEKVYPTEERHGNIEYWRCPDCGKLFSDENGEHEITQADTVLPLFTFEDDGEYIKLVSYNGNDENVIVPDKVPEDYPDEALSGEDYSIIKEEAFKGNSTIRNVIMQDNIAHIGDSAFEDCENLTEITVGTNLDYIGMNCFYNSPKLKKITIYSKDSRFELNVYAFDHAGDDVTVYGYRNTKVQEKVEAADVPFVPLDPEEIQDITFSVDKTWDIDFAEKDKPGSI